MKKLFACAFVLGLGCGLAVPSSAASGSKRLPVVPDLLPQGVTTRTTVARDTGPKYSVKISNDAAVSAGIGFKAMLNYFADDQGRALYVRIKDACKDQCADTYRPYAAAANARPFGDWTVVAAKGGKQWAYRGQPLYTFAEDQKDGDKKGAIPEDGWEYAVIDAAQGMKMPQAVIKVQALDNAGGYGLVDAQGKPIYMFDGDPTRDKTSCITNTCVNYWVPLATGQASRPVGDFTVVTGGNGLYQWAYKGHPLYTYTGDVLPGEVNGTHKDSRWHFVLLTRNFMPPSAVIAYNKYGGVNLTTVDGMTIYQRARWHSVVGGHDVRRGLQDDPKLGRLLGRAACDAACEREWPPVLAPQNAKTTGNWEVLDREDGKKQWAYRGYALYTSTKDKNPGDMNGENLLDYYPVGEVDPYLERTNAGEGSRSYGLSTMYWHATTP